MGLRVGFFLKTWIIYPLGDNFTLFGAIPFRSGFPPLRHTLGTRVYPYRILRHHGTEMDRCIKDDGLLHGYGGHEVIHGTILLLMIISAH